MADITIKLIADTDAAIPLHVDSPTTVGMEVTEVFIDRGDVPEYTGAYTVTPSASVQTLPTNGLMMTDDVTVDAVPSGNLKTPSGTYRENLLIGYLDIAYGVDTAGYLPVSSSSYPIRLMDVLPTENPKTVTPTTSEQVAVMQNKWTKGQIKVGAIPSQYIVPTGTKAITANTSSVDVKTYEFASVNVPNSYAAADEGKVVSNGALVAQTSDTVTANDTYDTTLINSLTVNVSGGGGQSITLLASGSYTKTDGTSAPTVLELPISVSGTPLYAYIIAESPVANTNQTCGWFGFFDIPQTAKTPVNLTYVSRAIRYSNANAYSQVDARCELTSADMITCQRTNSSNSVLNNTYTWYVWGYAS